MTYNGQMEQPDIPEYLDPELIYLDKELKENIFKALDLLGIKCKKLMELWKLNYSMKEIVDKLNIKVKEWLERQNFNVITNS